MNKSKVALLLILVSSCASASQDLNSKQVVPDSTTDVTSAEINWVADIPTVVAGQWVTMTGADGGSVKDGVLTINNDGSFTSDEVQLEIRNYDNETGQISDGLQIGTGETGDIVASKVTYQAEAVTFSSEKGYETNGVEADLKETTAINTDVNPGAKYEVTDSEGWKTSWTIANRSGGELPVVIAGDKITATTVIRADVEFAAAAL